MGSQEQSHSSEHLGNYGKLDTPVLAVMVTVSTVISHKADSLHLEIAARRVQSPLLKKIRFNCLLH